MCFTDAPGRWPAAAAGRSSVTRQAAGERRGHSGQEPPRVPRASVSPQATEKYSAWPLFLPRIASPGRPPPMGGPGLAAAIGLAPAVAVGGAPTPSREAVAGGFPPAVEDAATATSSSISGAAGGPSPGGDPPGAAPEHSVSMPRPPPPPPQQLLLQHQLTVQIPGSVASGPGPPGAGEAAVTGRPQTAPSGSSSRSGRLWAKVRLHLPWTVEWAPRGHQGGLSGAGKGPGERAVFPGRWLGN